MLKEKSSWGIHSPAALLCNLRGPYVCNCCDAISLHSLGQIQENNYTTKLFLQNSFYNPLQGPAAAG